MVYGVLFHGVFWFRAQRIPVSSCEILLVSFEFLAFVSKGLSDFRLFRRCAKKVSKGLVLRV